MKIVTIGPFPPLRGGISDFHYALFKQLSKNNDVSVINFKKLYPNILFPGKTQYQDKKVNNDNVYSVINPINIFTWFRGKKIIKKINPDKVIISYWHFFFIPVYLYLLKRIKKGNRYILFHNVISHQNKPYERYLLKLLLKHVDYCIVMNSFSRNQIINLNKDKEIIDAFHPLYRVDSRSYTKDTAKEALKISNKNVILFFGLIRDYKGLDLLINSVKYLNNRISDLKVLVVGENYESMSKYYDLIDKANLKDKFLFDLQFVGEHDTIKYFISSDIVVLPYKTASQSGIISLAYNFNRPVVVTDVGGLKEYVVENKTGFIVNPDEKDLSDKINYFFENKLFEEMSLFIKNYKEKFSWKNFEEKINGR